MPRLWRRTQDPSFALWFRNLRHPARRFRFTAPIFYSTTASDSHDLQIPIGSHIAVSPYGSIFRVPWAHSTAVVLHALHTESNAFAGDISYANVPRNATKDKCKAGLKRTHLMVTSRILPRALWHQFAIRGFTDRYIERRVYGQGI